MNNKFRGTVDDSSRLPTARRPHGGNGGGGATGGVLNADGNNALAMLEQLMPRHSTTTVAALASAATGRAMTTGSLGTAGAMLSGMIPAGYASHSPSSLFSPHHIPSTGDVYRADPSDVFPATPYMQTGSAFIKPELRSSLATAAQHLQSGGRPVTTTVTSSKFSQYTTIYNLESEPKSCAVAPKVKTQMYHTTARFAGKDIVLRRLAHVSISQADCTAAFDRLRHFRHPNLVPLTGILSTDEFILGSNDVIMEYRYIRGARSLHDAFFTEGNRATEGLLWSLVCQLVGLIRAFHEAATPLRGLHFSKLLYLESCGRFYFSGLGLVHLIDPKPTAPPQHLARVDIQSLGLILLQLATRNPNALPEHVLLLRQLGCYSDSFCQLVMTCLEASTEIAKLCHALGERLSMEVGHQEGHSDYFLSQCAKEIHNGRLMRLMVKLNIVLETSRDVNDYAQDPERYALRLFSQYVFNQVDEQNRTRLDWGHVFHSLNKLDCGSDDLIQLISTEGTSTVLVISFRDIRDMLNRTFDQLRMSMAEMDIAFSPVLANSPGPLQL